MKSPAARGRLSLWQAAWVIARRDFTAIVFSRAFLFFLLGPLFPVIIGVLAGSMGQRINEQAVTTDIGVAMQGADLDAILAARERLAEQLGPVIPEARELARLEPGEDFDAVQALGQREGDYAAIVTGTLEAPRLVATPERLARWRGVVGLLAANASQGEAAAVPQVETVEVASSGASVRQARATTAQVGQTVLFLLIMLLAGMVLSNLVEEKGNKIIEILAAALPMDAVFLGKLFAMLGVSMVGLLIWGGAAAAMLPLAGFSLSGLPDPGVGWPMFLILGLVYFATGYLLLGSIFLGIGSLAATVREVQTLSLPVTMAQVLVFFLAASAMANMGEPIEWVAILFPLSSALTMFARAAQDGALWPHALAILWQALWVLIFVRFGAGIFRKRVMQSGPRSARKWPWARRPRLAEPAPGPNLVQERLRSTEVE